jgi:hypothetical protein
MPPVGIDQLLCLGVEQDDCCAANFDHRAHLTVKGPEVVVLKAWRDGENLKLCLDRTNLTIHIGEQIFYSLPISRVQ